MRKLILRGHRYRIYPTKEQKEIIAKIFGCTRFVYNCLLEKCNEYYEKEGKILNYWQCKKILEELKGKEENNWLLECDQDALDYEIRNLMNAFDMYQRGINGHPKFHMKKSDQKYTTRNRGRIFMWKEDFYMPSLDRVKVVVSDDGPGRILSACLIKEANGKYYVSILSMDHYKILEPSGKIVGLDQGLKDLVITSDGVKYPNLRYMAKLQKKLGKEQRKLFKKLTTAKKKGISLKTCSNYNKQRIKVASIYKKITNQRKDMLQKLTTELIRKFDVICVEDLAIKEMQEEKKFSYSMNDACWGEFVRMLEYKARWNDKIVIRVSRYYPSSQICSECGTVHPELKDLRIRKWNCPDCGAIHDRDVNAAVNIKLEGMRILGLR